MTKVSAFTQYYKGMTNVIRTNIKVSNNNILDSENSINAIGIWDTGATECAISSNLAKKLNLEPTGKAQVGTANGIVVQDYYVINLTLPNDVMINDVVANEIPEIVGADMLIGMSVINKGDFSISNHNNETVMSFRIPSLAETDYVELLKRQVTVKSNKVGRNEACPCGSGKKYKNCCGR